MEKIVAMFFIYYQLEYGNMTGHDVIGLYN